MSHLARAEVCKALEVTEKTYDRWRQRYRGMTLKMASSSDPLIP